MDSSSPQATSRTRRYLRYLQLGFSITSGIACVLLVVLWVRSYWRIDQFIRVTSNANYVACTSADGRLLLGKSDDPILSTALGGRPSPRHYPFNWSETANIAFFPASVSPDRTPTILPLPRFTRDFYIHPGKFNSYEITIPYWLLFAPIALLTAGPWIRWRFSLRTLLIATTVVAVVLGAIIYAAR